MENYEKYMKMTTNLVKEEETEINSIHTKADSFLQEERMTFLIPATISLDESDKKC